MAVTDGKSGNSPGRASLSRSSMRNIQKQANLNWVGLSRDANEEEQETRSQYLIIRCDHISVCGVVWCGVVWCGVVWCGVVWCGVV